MNCFYTMPYPIPADLANHHRILIVPLLAQVLAHDESIEGTSFRHCELKKGPSRWSEAIFVDYSHGNTEIKEQ